MKKDWKLDVVKCAFWLLLAVLVFSVFDAPRLQRIQHQLHSTAHE